MCCCHVAESTQSSCSGDLGQLCLGQLDGMDTGSKAGFRALSSEAELINVSVNG